jgi:hypothetical protein
MAKRGELQKASTHARTWRRFHRKVDQILGAIGRAGSWGDDADYWIVGCEGGLDAVQIDLRNLDLLRSDVLGNLQASLGGDPDWSITISISRPHAGGDMPGMLTIYANEIIDELERDCLPERFRDVVFGKLGADIRDDIAERVRRLMNKPPTS